ncbi:MAG: hypothetical protein K2L17_03230 [Muribaculaceae bacterium]|nr:hypothetical protein [Muribaculaceae bacterium]
MKQNPLTTRSLFVSVSEPMAPTIKKGDPIPGVASLHYGLNASYIKRPLPSA